MLMWGIVCGVIFIAAGVTTYVMSSGGELNQRVLYWFYERMGPRVYAEPENTDWNILIESLVLRGDERILDVGTAVGDFPLFLAHKPEFQGEIVGIDWSGQMVEVARRSAVETGLGDRVRFEQVDVREGLPYPSQAFDVVVCIGVLETIGEQAIILYDLRRVLKPDGKLVLSRFRGWSSGSANRIQSWYEQQLATFGMEVEQVIAFRPSHDLMIIRFKTTK